MKTEKLLSGIILFLFIINQTFVLAQETGQPVSSLEVKKELDKIFGLDQDLCSGIAYTNIVKGSVSGNPYWIDAEWKTGSVLIGNLLFEDLLLKYDIESNDLIINTINLNNQPLKICLNKKLISKFTLGNHQFIKFPGEKINDNNFFCEVLSEGKIIFLLIKDKTLSVSNSRNSSDFSYKEYRKSYLLLDGKLIKFKGKRTLYRLFPEHKQKLKKYISQNSLYPVSKNIQDRTMLVNYCNSLITKP